MARKGDEREVMQLSDVGNGLYGLVANTGVELPLISKISVGSFYPDLGKD